MLVFPMAGLSSRFQRAGYTNPKFMLPLHGFTTFDFSVAGFVDRFEPSEFVFIFRETGGVREFLKARLSLLGLDDAVLIELDGVTEGQADTVMRGIQRLDLSFAEPLTIFNIDTFRSDFQHPHFENDCDGYLEVFIGDGENWSFVKPLDSSCDNKVARTAEKEPISNLCCSGLYHFRRSIDFVTAFNDEILYKSSLLKELYVAPIFNHLIKTGRDIRYHIIDRSNVVFCGVPEEYREAIECPEILSSLSHGLKK
jgi:hypothetical protein